MGEAWKSETTDEVKREGWIRGSGEARRNVKK
jgi:hypothetical protein